MLRRIQMIQFRAQSSCSALCGLVPGIDGNQQEV